MSYIPCENLISMNRHWILRYYHLSLYGTVPFYHFSLLVGQNVSFSACFGQMHILRGYDLIISYLHRYNSDLVLS